MLRSGWSSAFSIRSSIASTAQQIENRSVCTSSRCLQKWSQNTPSRSNSKGVAPPLPKSRQPRSSPSSSSSSSSPSTSSSSSSSPVSDSNSRSSSTSSASSARSSISGPSPSTSKLDREAIPSIYPDSKAASRPFPNASPLFNHFLKGSGSSDPLHSRSSNSSSSKSALTITLRNAAIDPLLKQLYTSLGNAAESHDVAWAIQTCFSIRKRKQELQRDADASSISFDPQEKVVFLALLRALSYHGLFNEASAVVNDMISCGFHECIESLNHLLKAAVVSANAEGMESVLDRIADLSGPSRSASASNEVSDKLYDMIFNQGRVSSLPQTAPKFEFPWSYVSNWNGNTCSILIEAASQSYNLEYGLAVLATCYKLNQSLPHDTLSKLLALCLHNQEFRIAVELADMIEQGGLTYQAESSSDAQELILRSSQGEQQGHLARRLPPSTWMSILRMCADGGYLPGVELAWHRAVVKGLQKPDEGILLLILALAAKEGSVEMAKSCLQQLDPNFQPDNVSATIDDVTLEHAKLRNKLKHNLPPAWIMTKRREIQEWHLAPLFEAQCSAGDFEGAMRTLCGIEHRGFAITSRLASRLSTSIHLGKESALEKAKEALYKAGNDKTLGTRISVVNAILNAAFWLGQLETAMDIYQKIPALHVIAGVNGEPPPANRSKFLKPNAETFNALFNICIDRKDKVLGTQLLKDMNLLKVKPDVTTFERMVLLCCTQENYEDAFGFMEEAKAQDMIPSETSYEGLTRTCFRAKDERWKRVLEEMREAGYNATAFQRRLEQLSQ